MLNLITKLKSAKKLLSSQTDDQRAELASLLSGFATSGLVDPDKKPLLHSGLTAAVSGGDATENIINWMSSMEALEALERQRSIQNASDTPKVFLCPHCNEPTDIEARLKQLNQP